MNGLHSPPGHTHDAVHQAVDDGWFTHLRINPETSIKGPELYDLGHLDPIKALPAPLQEAAAIQWAKRKPAFEAALKRRLLIAGFGDESDVDYTLPRILAIGDLHARSTATKELTEALVELHQPFNIGPYLVCMTCQECTTCRTPLAWPCPTLEALTIPDTEQDAA